MKKHIIRILFLCTTLVSTNLNVNAAEPSRFNSTDLYEEKTNCIEVFNSLNREAHVTDDDVYLMAQIVYAESRSEPFDGKVAVASVILNRLEDPSFPNTIEGVIKQKGAFSCVNQESIDVIPDESSYAAVLEALKGNDPTASAVFFYNPQIATSSWMKNVRKHNIKTIGNHVFFVTK